MKQSELPVEANYFQALTGVRAIAAWLVFFHHYNPFSIERFGSVINQFVQEFHVGVSVFFVLSGFLITHRCFKSPSGFRWQPYLVTGLPGFPNVFSDHNSCLYFTSRYIVARLFSKHNFLKRFF
jgi:hypothetical protein